MAIFSGDTAGVHPIKATVGGGIFFNQTEEDKAFLSQYDNANALGSFAYKSFQKTPHNHINHQTPEPSEAPAQGETADGGYTEKNTNLTVNNLNPTTIPELTDPKTKKSASNSGMNHFIDGYLNAELNYWYYSNFGPEIRGSIGLEDYNVKFQQYKLVHDFMADYLPDLLVFEFGAMWNDLEKVTGELNTYEKVGKDFLDLINDGLGELSAFEGWGWVASWAVDVLLDWILDASLTHYETVDHNFKYISQPFSLQTIDNIFGDILGRNDQTTLPSRSVIQQFINQNGCYPGSLKLQNFSFNVNNYSAYNEKRQNYEWSTYATGSVDPRWHWTNQKKPFSKSWNTNINTSKITPDISFDIIADRADPDYSSEKAILDDPRNSDKGDAIPFAMGLAQTIPPSDWPKDGVVDLLNGAWESMGGLVPELYNDVVYTPVTLIKGTPVLVQMYFKDGILGFTKNNPLYFYVKGH